MWLHLKQVGERLTSHHTGRKMAASKYTK